MRMPRLRPLLILATASFVSVSSSAHAFEPITTLLGIVGGPIFCKIISCRTTENNIVYIRQQNNDEIVKRLEVMKDNFVWEDKFCRSSPMLETGQQICFDNDKMFIKKD
jgi:hypothetical protein